MATAELEAKVKLRREINLVLLAVAFIIFALTISFKASLFKSIWLLAFQSTLAMPLLLASLFACAKVGVADRVKMWEKFSYITSTLAYAFLINVVGLLLAQFSTKTMGVVFFIANILMAAIYSYLEIKENPSKLRSRIYKDVFFAALIILGGLLPALRIY